MQMQYSIPYIDNDTKYQWYVPDILLKYDIWYDIILFIIVRMTDI